MIQKTRINQRGEVIHNQGILKPKNGPEMKVVIVTA